jgi:hypothetical protein
MNHPFDPLSSFVNPSRPAPRSRVTDTHGLSACEPLEERRLFAVGVTGSVTLDESPVCKPEASRSRRGQQRQRRHTRHAAEPGVTFYNRLFGAGGLA